MYNVTIENNFVSNSHRAYFSYLEYSLVIKLQIVFNIEIKVPNYLFVSGI